MTITSIIPPAAATFSMVPAGPAGARGATILRGSGAPSNGNGLDGDFYVRTSNGDLYEKSSGSWSVVGNITGPVNVLGIGTVTTLGPDASATASISGTSPDQDVNLGIPRGARFFRGSGAPSGGTGENGDYYIRTSNGDLYVKSSGSWSVLINILGPANTLAIGSVTTGAAGDPAAAVITGTAPNQTLDLTIPQGIQGEQGPIGEGDVNGPESSTANDIAQFADATGKLLKGGISIDTDTTLAANSDSRLATQKAVKAYADGLIAANDAMVFKGVQSASGNPNYPAANRGDTYRISVAGKIGGGSGPNVEVGDMLICMTDGTAAGNHATVGAQWAIIQVNLDGAMVTGSYPTLVSLEGLSLAAGDLLYATAADTLARLPKGTALQKLRMNAGATAPEWATEAAAGITLGTKQATTSGTSVTFSGFPAGTKRIKVLLDDVSLSGTNDITLYLGDSGGIEYDGWIGSVAVIGSSGTTTGGTSNQGLTIKLGTATYKVSGIISLELMDASTNTWIAHFAGGGSGGTNSAILSVGRKSLSAALTQLEISGGVNSLDSGAINVTWE